MNQFKDFQELWHFLNTKPVEPKRYEPEPEKLEEKPKKATKKKGKKEDGEVLQAD